jgi:hypothetical protein
MSRTANTYRAAKRNARREMSPIDRLLFDGPKTKPAPLGPYTPRVRFKQTGEAARRLRQMEARHGQS